MGQTFTKKRYDGRKCPPVFNVHHTAQSTEAAIHTYEGVTINLPEN